MKYTPEAWKTKGQFSTLVGRDIFYVEEGSGPTILLLHGFPTSSWDWSWIWDDLVTDYHLLSLDFLGYGFSDKPTDHTYKFSEQVDIVEELANRLDVHSCHLIAHDYGDTVAQEILARSQENKLSFDIKSTYLLNGGIFPEKIQFRLIQRLLLSPIGFLISKLLSRGRFHKSFAAIFGEDYQPSEQLLDQFWKIIKTHNGHRLGHKLIKYIDERFDNRDRWVNALQSVDIPLRFVVGMEDPVSGKLMVERFEELVSANTRKFDDVGHYPQVETPDLVLDDYLEFIHS